MFSSLYPTTPIFTFCTTMSAFPWDLLTEILSRLPIASVLCFRCVSKSWRALIDGTDFAKLHLNRSLKINSNLQLILRETDRFVHKKRCFYSLPIDSLNSPVVSPQELINPLKSCDFHTKIFGSCHGLLLISNSVDDIALWNPSTGKYKKLPVLSVGKEDGIVRFGFGYDAVSDDYKVVRLVQFFGGDSESGMGPFSSDVNVYSLKSNSWKGVDEFPYYVRNMEQPGTFLNGALHWVAISQVKTITDCFQRLIVAFDLATEKCRVVLHPHINYDSPDESFSVKLDVLGGSLCAFHTYWDEFFYDDWGNLDRALHHMDIWVMKEYGVEGSWTMITSIDRPYENIGRAVVPLTYSKSGEEILVELDYKRFVWTSIKEGSTKIVDTQFGTLRDFVHFNSYVYMGSLVQLGSNDDKSNLKKQFNQDKGEKKIIKKRGNDFLSKGFKLKL